METPCIYQIRVREQLTKRLSGWFDGFSIHNEANGETTLTGQIDDQASLFGILSKIQALNLTLLAVNRLPVQTGDDPVP